jgi:hypothetical protein
VTRGFILRRINAGCAKYATTKKERERMETKEKSVWTQRYREDKRESFQVRLSLEHKKALHDEANARGITCAELIRQYAEFLMEEESK